MQREEKFTAGASSTLEHIAAAEELSKRFPG